MYINQVFELTMLLDKERFQKVLNRAYKRTEYIAENEGEYVDHSLSPKGITVVYRDSQYKKKVKLIIEPRLVLDSKVLDSDRFIRKLNKRINEYFDFKYRLDDFVLSGVILAADIDVHDQKNVSSYLKVLQRIGRVKGYSPADYDCFEDVDSFCLVGNSNHIKFWLYDLKGLLDSRFRNGDIEQKSLYLAQKAMNCRNIEKVMEEFAKINVSSITISKRHDIKCLENVYSFLLYKK